MPEGAVAGRCSHVPDPSTGPFVNRVRIYLLRAGTFISAIDGFLACGASHVVHFVPAHPTVLARRSPRYREILNRGELNVPDGVSVQIALRLMGRRTERLPGSRAVELLCAFGVDRGLGHAFYGGTPAVVERLAATLASAHPGIRITAIESPPFRDLSDAELEDAADRLRATGTDVLWVGLGTPKQDLVARKLQLATAAPVILCVGAAFDFLSGSKQRAPRWVQAIGMEWMHRLASEPQRLWSRYLVGNPQFVLGVATDYARSRLGRKPSHR